MNPVETTPTPVYYDRTVGLIIFGLLTVALGLLAGLFTILIAGSYFVTSSFHTPGVTPLPLSSLIPALALYGIIAVILIWLGIGSCLYRRWARAILCVGSWSWLIVGVIAVTMLAFVLPGTMGDVMAATAKAQGRPPPPAAATTAILVMMFAVYGMIFVVVPAVWTFFYNSRHVKATCDYRDPVERWTDRCPLPLLAVVLWAGLSVPMLIIMAVGGRLVMPVFGFLASGAVASILFVLLALIWGISAFLFYRRDILGWWLLLATMVLLVISSMITYSLHGLDEIYRLMNFPEDQIELISSMNITRGGFLVWSQLVFFVPAIAYLFFCRRYFRTP